MNNLVPHTKVTNPGSGWGHIPANNIETVMGNV
jgi:hypothetical protein